MNSNTNTTVPDFLPVLSRGRHEFPWQGACIMEYVSIIAGERFSDQPTCVHPLLARWARSVNDHIPDEQRHLLIPLINRFIGTAAPLPPSVAGQLRSEFDRHGSMYTGSGCPCCTTPGARAMGPTLMAKWLEEALNIYDRVTGRVSGPGRMADVQAAAQLVAEAKEQRDGRITRRLGLKVPSTPVGVEFKDPEPITMASFTVALGQVNKDVLSMYYGEKVLLT